MRYTASYGDDAYQDFITIREALAANGIELLGCEAGNNVLIIITETSVPQTTLEFLGLSETS